MIDQLSGWVEEAMAPFRGAALDLLDTIPGINQATAEVIIAETGGDMTRFATAKHLASWAGVCPGHHESASSISVRARGIGECRPRTALAGPSAV
jgi:transposase